VLVFKRILVMFFVLSTGVSFSNLENETILVIGNYPVSQTLLSSNAYTQPETDLRTAYNPLVSLDGSVLVDENEHLSLYINPEDLSIDIFQKDTEYVWSSTIHLDYAKKDENDEPLFPDQTTEGDRGLNSLIWRNKVASPVWISYFGGSENNPQLREESFFESSNSRFDLDILSNGISVQLFFGISQIELTYEVTLTERGFDVSLRQDSIKENSNALLSNVSIYPFFGAAKKELIPGYIMVPDGVGALFRFDQFEDFTSPYQKPFYGRDFAISTFVDETSITGDDLNLTANTYGAIHGINQQGYLNILKEGQAYATLTVYPADVITDFFFAYTTFTYRSSYRQPLNQSQTNSVLRVQEETNPFDIHMDYQLLSNEQANYVGMAQTYQEYLIQRENLELNLDAHQPLHLDILMQDNERVFIGRNTFLMTTAKDILNMIESFDDDMLYLTLRGTSDHGYSGASLDIFPLSSDLGSKEDWESIFTKQNVSIYLYLEPLKLYTNGRFHSQLEIARGRHLLSYRFSDDYGTYDYVNPYNYETYLQSKIEAITAFGFDGVAFENLGNTIYGSFGDSPFTRGEVLDLTKTLVSHQTVYQGYDFAFGSDALFQMPLTHSQHAKMTDTVPFITYALAGYQDVFGPYHNYFGNTSNMLLKMIDFHVSPSFQITQESPYRLLNSPNQTWFSTRFSIWENEIHRQKNVIYDVLRDVQGETIINRLIPEIGISIVTYSSGNKIIINYTNEDYTYEDVTVEKMSAFFYEVTS
jgi:hypothetical protein